MVTITHTAEDISSQTQNGQTTINRVMRVSADSVTEAAESTMIPKYGSRHPLNSIYTLTERNMEVVGNLNRKVQIKVELTYATASNSGGNSSGGNSDNKPPWKLGAYNIQISHISERAPLLQAWNSLGERVQMLNRAGTRIKVETNQYMRQISFNYSVKASNEQQPPINNTPLINANTETIAGFEFKPLVAMLQPMNASYVEDVDDSGRVYRKYWNISAVIIENNRTWRRNVLNIGTYAKFPGKKYPQQIYQYTPWESSDPNENIKVSPTYGSIDDVIAARKKYASAESDSSALANFPYQEVTEPMPLDLNGNIYMQAIENPDKYPYVQLAYFEFKPSNWTKWNLPKERM